MIKAFLAALIPVLLIAVMMGIALIIVRLTRSGGPKGGEG